MNSLSTTTKKKKNKKKKNNKKNNAIGIVQIWVALRMRFSECSLEKSLTLYRKSGQIDRDGLSFTRLQYYKASQSKRVVLYQPLTQFTPGGVGGGGGVGLVSKRLASTGPLGVGVSWFLRVSAL